MKCCYKEEDEVLCCVCYTNTAQITLGMFWNDTCHKVGYNT